MSIYRDLELLIREKADDDLEFETIKDALRLHIKGELPLKKLSKKARAVMLEWEHLMKQEKSFYERF